MNSREKLGFGCVGLTSQSFKHQAERILNVAFDNGITKFDTAPLYGRGYSERIIGSFLKNKRNKVIINSKVGLGLNNKYGLPTSLALPLYSLKRIIEKKSITNNLLTEPPKTLQYRQINKNYIEQSLLASLKNLRTDYIDNYFLHEALPNFVTEDGWSYLYKMQKNGVIHNIGIGTSYVNLENLQPNELENISYLQYENNYHHNSDDLMKKFSHKYHNFHSVLKFLGLVKNKQFSISQVAGYLLNHAVRKNSTGGVVLFSTKSTERMLENLKEFDNAEKLTSLELTQQVNSFY